MLRDLIDFLTFNKSERLGILILLTLIALIGAVYFFGPYFINPGFINDPALIARIDSLVAADTIATDKQNIRSDSLFSFDPNEIGTQEWVLLGLSKSQAEVIENYKAAGGKFYNKEDVRKMYTISDAMYEKLEPYIKTKEWDKKDRKSQSRAAKTNEFREPMSKIEINTADSGQLISLYGIGPVFASRIAGYRKLLGGFHNTGQLLEVYGMDSSRLIGFINEIKIDTTKIEAIPLMSAEFKDILRHPYISYEFTRFIFNNKKQIEKNGIGYLLEFEEMNDSLFQKIKPYLSLD